MWACTTAMRPIRAPGTGSPVVMPAQILQVGDEWDLMGLHFIAVVDVIVVIDDIIYYVNVPNVYINKYIYQMLTEYFINLMELAYPDLVSHIKFLKWNLQNPTSYCTSHISCCRTTMYAENQQNT